MKRKKLLCFFVLGLQNLLLLAQPTAGLVGHLKLDGNLNNSGSASITATSTNTSYTTNAVGTINKALLFAGTTASAVNITDNGNLDFTGDFSIAFGIYITTTALNQGFYDNGLNHGGCGVWFFTSDNTLRFNFKNGSIGAIAALPANQWKAICAVRSGSTMLLYVNGVQVMSGVQGTSSTTYPNAPVLGQMYATSVGGNYNPIANGSKIDEMRFYNRALSATEVAQLVGATLPLKMGEFTAAKNTGGIILNWETLSEQNTSFFEVERSTNGTDFITIGRVNANGNSSSKQNYSYTDINPGAGINCYRLKLADIDNAYTYSRTIVIKGNQVITIELFPNPVDNVLLVQLPSSKKETASIFITDASGKKVYTRQLQLSQGNNATSIPVLHLPKGIYQFTLNNNEGTQSKTFIKQ